MGEYWKPVNVSRKEWIHPHEHDEGLKWGEWTNPKSAVVEAMRAAWSSTDEIYALSDYDGCMRLDMNKIEHDGGWPTIKGTPVKRPANVPTYDDLSEGWGTKLG